MASTEDENYEGSILEGKEKKHETTSVVAGDVVLPDSGFGRQRDHKVKNFDKPVRCGKKNCKSNADARVHTYDGGPKNFCSEHWNKFKVNKELYDPQSFVAINPEEGQDWRGEDRVNRQISRANAEAMLAPVRGFHMPVMGPGNPREVTDPEAEIQIEDHITPVINNAIENGGRNRVEMPLIEFKNLLHQRKIGGRLPSNDEEVEAREIEAYNNPSTSTSNSFDDYKSIMSSDSAPLPRDTKN
jgi:hypothetical protein